MYVIRAERLLPMEAGQMANIFQFNALFAYIPVPERLLTLQNGAYA